MMSCAPLFLARTAAAEEIAVATPVITSIATDNRINDLEKSAVHVVGTAESGLTINVSLTHGATVSGVQTASSGAFDIVLDVTSLADGTITPSVTATDAAGNVSAAAVTPTAWKDVVLPVITLLGSTPLTVAYGTEYEDAGATALDSADGNLTNKIVTVEHVKTSVPGTYTVTYNVADSAQNKALQVTRTVIVSPKATSTDDDGDDGEGQGAVPAIPGKSTAIPAVLIKGARFQFLNNLGVGITGPDVTELQKRLAAEGFYTGPITGYFGPLTFRAVKDYQRSMGVVDTGYVGPLTKAKLNSGLGHGVEFGTGTPATATATVDQVMNLRIRAVGLMRQLIELLQKNLNEE